MIQLWAENDFSQPPTNAEIAGIASEYSHTFPVLGDPGWGAFNAALNSNYTPAHALIAPGMQKVSSTLPSAAQIEAVLPE